MQLHSVRHYLLSFHEIIALHAEIARPLSTEAGIRCACGTAHKHSPADGRKGEAVRGSLVRPVIVSHHLNCGGWDWFLRRNAKRPQTLAETRAGATNLGG